MRVALACLAALTLGSACSRDAHKSSEPEGHASIFECVDGRNINTREVPMSALDDIETRPYVDCGDGACAFEGETCPTAPAPPAPVEPTPAPTATGDIDFEAPDRTCETDDDCEAIYKWYERDGACCRGCSTDAVARSWLDGARKKCSAMGSEGCPLKKCRELAPISCEQGTCTVGERP